MIKSSGFTHIIIYSWNVKFGKVNADFTLEQKIATGKSL